MPSLINVQPIGDLYNATFRVLFYRDAITSKQDAEGKPAGNDVTSLTSDDATANSELTDILRSSVTSVEVTSVADGQGRAVVTIEPPQDMALILISNPLLSFNTIMEIEWGYFDNSSNQVSGKHLYRVTRPQIKFGQETTVTIDGIDMGQASAMETARHRQWTTLAYSSDWFILIELSTYLKYDLDVANLPPETTLYKAREKDDTQADADWIYFQRVCARHDISFVMGAPPLAIGLLPRIVLYDNNDAARGAPTYTLRWRQPLSSEFDLPIESIDMNPLGSFFAAPGSRGATSIFSNPDTGVVDRQAIDAAFLPDRGASNKRTLVTTQPAPATTGQSSESSSTPSPRQPTEAAGVFLPLTPRAFAQEEARQLIRWYDRVYAGTQLHVVVPGLPTFVPKTVVRVEGLGTVFSGTYLIMSVKHTLRGDYSCMLDLLAAPSQDPHDTLGVRALGPEPKDIPLVGADFFSRGGETVPTTGPEGFPPVNPSGG